ncbi:MAG: hypothetical protein M1503_04155 [Thaumarchaeota archaeon]|nr:hypothetical protein [Nitrososphaerota archaeon]MCL5317446.1 hypothetical protein [Nitrososphaerota archaeon]
MHKRLVTILPLAILALFALSLVSNPFNAAMAQQQHQSAAGASRDDNEAERAKTAVQLTKILEKAEEHINGILQDLAAQNITVPAAAKASYESGLAHAEAAIKALKENRTQDAEREITASMSDFKTALSQFKDNSTVTAATPEENGISQAINRSRVFIERLETVVSNLNSTEYPVSDIKARIQSAKTILDNATVLLQRGNVTEAAKKLGEARRAISGLIGELNNISKDEKSKKIKEFSEKALERLTDIEQKADELLPPQAAGKVKAALEQAKQHITQARDLADNERLEQAVDKLEDMSEAAKAGDEEFDHGFEQDKALVAQKIKTAIANETKRLDALQQRVDALGNVKGLAKVREIMDDARQMLQKASDKLASGDVQSAGKILKDLSDLTEKITDWIKDAVKSGNAINGEDRSGDRENEGRGKR